MLRNKTKCHRTENRQFNNITVYLSPIEKF